MHLTFDEKVDKFNSFKIFWTCFQVFHLLPGDFQTAEVSNTLSSLIIIKISEIRINLVLSVQFIEIVVWKIAKNNFFQFNNKIYIYENPIGIYKSQKLVINNGIAKTVLKCDWTDGSIL